MSKLNNKIALVTGASRGIGHASALALAKDGAHVIAHYNNASDEAHKLVNEIQKMGGKAEAVGLGVRGIRVNAVAPGVIETDMSNFTKTESGRNLALGMQALTRIGQPSDVADVIAFLCSDGARWITGASIPVDGGPKL